MGGPHDPDEFIGLREFSEYPRLSAGESTRSPSTLLFWTDALAKHAGLPLNQVIYSYNPLTFLLSCPPRNADRLACRVQDGRRWNGAPRFSTFD